MKRLSLLSLFVLGTGLLAATAVAQTPSALPRVADPVILIAVDDTAFTQVDETVDIDVLANDIETNTGFLKVLIDFIVTPRNGAANIEREDPREPEDDFIRYTPSSGFFGKDSLQYKLGNSNQREDSAWVFIYVNRPPMAAADSFDVLPDTMSALDVLANDTDLDADSLQIDSLLTLPAHGTATFVDTTGAELEFIYYTPDAGFTGRDSLQYAVFDGKNGQDSAWVFLAVNLPPVAVDDSVTTLPGTPIDIAVLANDSDPEGDTLAVASIPTPPLGGAAVINGAVITYTPNAGFTGFDTFVYAVADELGGQDIALVVVAVNTPPVAVDDNVSTPFVMPLDVAVLANDTDADGHVLMLDAVVTPPSNGTAVIDNDVITYTPNADFFGTDSLTYSISDGFGGTDQATVRVQVLADAAVQFIHNALPAGPVDVYVNDARLLDDFDFRRATPYLTLPAGDARVDVTEAGAADNSAPLFTTTLTLAPTEAYVVIANGVVGQNFDVLVKENARPVANDSSGVEVFVAHGVFDAPAAGMDVRLLNPSNNNLPSLVLADDLDFEGLTDYIRVAPDLHNVDAANFNGSTQYDIYRFDLTGFAGETVTLVLSGVLEPGATGDPAFTLLGFDAQGQGLALATSTDTEAELPEEFALRGNFPNPFNPTTTIQFDLPEAADVTVELVDVLGRVVLVLPEKEVEAGANRTLQINAARLASGTYFYRVLARTATDVMIQTGQMTLVK